MLVFRNMTRDDIEKIAVLEKEVFSDAWTSKGISETYGQSQAVIAVADSSGELAGYCIVYYVMDEGEIARIAVNENMRRQGVGRGLLDYVCVCCKAKKIERLLLDVRESNVGARAFYQQYGFTEDGIRKNFYENPKENAVLMSKMLT